MDLGGLDEKSRKDSVDLEENREGTWIGNGLMEETGWIRWIFERNASLEAPVATGTRDTSKSPELSKEPDGQRLFVSRLPLSFYTNTTRKIDYILRKHRKVTVLSIFCSVFSCLNNYNLFDRDFRRIVCLHL
jgi:hypothetical protein